jgi:hypothetical protein
MAILQITEPAGGVSSGQLINGAVIRGEIVDNVDRDYLQWLITLRESSSDGIIHTLYEIRQIVGSGQGNKHDYVLSPRQTFVTPRTSLSYSLLINLVSDSLRKEANRLTNIER